MGQCFSQQEPLQELENELLQLKERVARLEGREYPVVLATTEANGITSKGQDPLREVKGSVAGLPEKEYKVEKEPSPTAVKISVPTTLPSKTKVVDEWELSATAVARPDRETDGRYFYMDADQLPVPFELDEHKSPINKAKVKTVKTGEGMVLLVTQERTGQTRGVLLWKLADCNQYLGCWNPVQHAKDHDWQENDAIVFSCPRRIARTYKTLITKVAGWNLVADHSAFGRCGLVGDWWKELEIQLEASGSENVIGVWTDALELSYALSYQVADDNQWCLYKESCKGITKFSEAVNNKKTWRLRWETTSFKHTQGLSTCRGGGGLHAELLLE